MKVLSEMIKHHVKEEEKPDGMFAVARESNMDLVALGEELAARKAELESGDDRRFGYAAAGDGRDARRDGSTHERNSLALTGRTPGTPGGSGT